MDFLRASSLGTWMSQLTLDGLPTWSTTPCPAQWADDEDSVSEGAPDPAEAPTPVVWVAGWSAGEGDEGYNSLLEATAAGDQRGAAQGTEEKRNEEELDDDIIADLARVLELADEPGPSESPPARDMQVDAPEDASEAAPPRSRPSFALATAAQMSPAEADGLTDAARRAEEAVEGAGEEAETDVDMEEASTSSTSSDTSSTDTSKEAAETVEAAESAEVPHGTEHRRGVDWQNRYAREQVRNLGGQGLRHTPIGTTPATHSLPGLRSRSCSVAGEPT
jgi:hypothetical protein